MTITRGAKLRKRILGSVGALVVVSLLAASLSLYRITEVNRSLEKINRVGVPLARVLTQMQTDAEVLRRELNRGMGVQYWADSHWTPKPVPRWIFEVIDKEIERARELVGDQTRWREWVSEMATKFAHLREDADSLYQALSERRSDDAAKIYPKWNAALEDWTKQVQWGAGDFERGLKQDFARAQERVAQLRMGLQGVLMVVVCLGCLLLWLGERALRPLEDLTRLAREITRRGLRKEDKLAFPSIPMGRDDEVSGLATEFHRMATQLLEREKVVESQKQSLEDQNILLKEMGRLNETVLNSMSSMLFVTDLEHRITRCNPLAAQFLGAKRPEALTGASLYGFAAIRTVVPPLARDLGGHASQRIEPKEWMGRIYGGSAYPLAEGGETRGTVVVLEDLTETTALQERLQEAEQLAAVGRLSAQVAHEVRNPLHSIGLEAELAIDEIESLEPDRLAAAKGRLRASVQSIQQSVERLERITANYLKLSKLSPGARTPERLPDLLLDVIATYASVFEERGIKIDWKIQPGGDTLVSCDRALVEQAIGNLFKNAVQALEGVMLPRIQVTIGAFESGRVFLRVEDNGPGVSAAMLPQLFKPFATDRAQGTGLGLSFVKKVIEEHRGEVRCLTSGGGMSGAKFELWLPQSQAGGLG